MILLIDLDSILYTSVYRIVGIQEMREAIGKFGKQAAKQWLLEEVYDHGVNRVESRLLKIQEYVDSQMIQDVTGVELFITTCTKSFRKELAPSYKAHRKRNKYVWLLRDHYQLNDAAHSDTLEADDLIAIRAREIGKDGYVIVSMDKDLKQIGGYYWSYYTVKSKDMQGNYIMNEYGNYETEYQQKAIDYITDQEAEFMFWTQVLAGDASDNIKGIEPISADHKKELEKEWGYKLYCRVGEATAKKILAGCKNYFIRAAREYIIRGQKENLRTNYKLLKLGNYAN